MKQIKMTQLTIFDDRTKIIDTQYGSIRFAEWLGKEKIRIEKDPGRHARLVVRSKRIALFVNPI